MCVHFFTNKKLWARFCYKQTQLSDDLFSRNLSSDINGKRDFTNISTLNKLVDCSFKMSLNGYNSGNNKLIAVIKGLNLKLILQDTVEIFVFCQRISNSTTVTQKMEIHQSLLSKTKKSYHYLGKSWIIYKNWKNIWRMTLYFLQVIYFRSNYLYVGFGSKPSD